MNIIELAREAGFDWHSGWTLDDDEPNRFVTFANAVIAERDKELIEGVGEPQLYGGITLDKKGKFKSTEDGYTATQVAAAVAKAKQEYQDNVNSFAAGASLRKERIATLESTLRVALEALEYHQEQTRPITSTTEAIKQIEEILK